jgi:hypothetical protein
MSLMVSLNLPADIEARVRREAANLDGEVTEAFAADLFRRGKLTHFDLSRVLKLDRFETDAWLKRHGVLQGSPTMADLDEDRRTLERVMGKAG